MAALTFYTIATFVLLQASSYTTFIIRHLRNREPKKDGTKRKSHIGFVLNLPYETWLPRPRNHVMTLVFACVPFLFLGWMGWLPFHLMPYGTAFHPGLFHHLVHSEEARATALGIAIALCAYGWYWDRRANFFRMGKAVEIAISDMRGAVDRNESVPRNLIYGKLLAAVDRADPWFLLFMLILIFSLAAVEGRGILASFETRVANDGSLSFRLRDDSAARRSNSTTILPSAKSGTATGAPSGHRGNVPVFAFIADRINGKDVPTLCAMVYWGAAYQGAKKKDDASLQSPKEHCNGMMNKDMPDVPDAWKALWKELADLREYDNLSKQRTRPMVQCFAKMGGPQRWILQDSLVRPIVVGYARLFATSKSDPNATIEKLPDEEVIQLLKALIDASKVLPRVLPDPSENDNPCIEFEKFGKKLKTEVDRLEAKSAPLCRPEYPEIAAMCRILQHDADLPYGPLTYAALAFQTGETIDAVWRLQEWLAGRSSDTNATKNPDGKQKIVAYWHMSIAAYFRDWLASNDKVLMPPRVRLDLTLLHSETRGESLLELFAPGFSTAAVGEKGKEGAICADPGLTSLVVLLATTLSGLEIEIELRTQLLRDALVLPDDGLDEALAADAVGQRIAEFYALRPCFTKSEIYGKEPAQARANISMLYAGVAAKEARLTIELAQFADRAEPTFFHAHFSGSQIDERLTQGIKRLETAIREMRAVRDSCANSPPANPPPDYCYQRRYDLIQATGDTHNAIGLNNQPLDLELDLLGLFEVLQNIAKERKLNVREEL